MLHCTTLVVVFLLLFKESNAQCNLSDTEKFDPQCAGANIESPSVVFLNQNFTLNIGLADINVQNVSLFNNSVDYCGPSSFAKGLQCIVTQTDDVQATSINVVCMEDTTYSITTGQISLIIGITGSVECSIPLSTSLNQTTSISIAGLKFVGTHYIIGSGDAVMNVSCQSIPNGPQPVLTYTPFNASEERSYQQSYVESSGTVVADFQDGIYSGVLSCSSIDGHSSLAYITLFEDLPIAYYPSGNNVTVIVGASLDISVVLLTNEDTDDLVFSAVEGNDRNNPIITSSDGINYQIEYTYVGIPPTSRHQLCFSYDGSGEGENSSEICTDSFNLYVKVPSIEISTTLSANLYSNFANEKVNISCVPSDLTAIVFWQSANSTPLWDDYPDFVFSPPGLNHTVTLTSAPNGIEVFFCGLYNYEDALLNEQNATVVSLTTPVSLWNGNNEVLNDSIINLFTINEDNEPVLSLRCFGTLEDGLLYWRSSNVTALPDILSFDDQINDLQLTTKDRDVTLQYSISSSHRIGYYMCQSNVTENTVTVFVTLDNPYWDLISESSILPLIGTNETIGIRFAYNSRGYGNSGPDITVDLTLEPQSNSLIDGLTTDPNQYYYYYTFTASTSNRGSFVFQAQQSNTSFTTVVDVYSIVPEFTSVTTPVYGRLSRMVSLSCTANDTIAPIVWGIWDYEEYFPINDEPGFSFQPPVINEEVSFQISTATLSNNMNYFYDVDSGSYSQIQFACGFMNGNDEGVYDASNVILNIREYDIQVENVYGYNTIKNNSVVNSFNVLDRKRNVELSDTFMSRCTVTQGNHEALWKVELFEDSSIAPPVLINNTYNDYLQATTVNPYESELTAYVNDNTTGRYTCESAITGIYNTFILTNENPFVRAKSEIQVNPFLGETIFITFWAAETSDGDFNRLSELDVIFTDTTNNVATLEAVQNCDYEKASGCYEYELEIVATPSSAGLYMGQISDCYPLENGTEVCSYARDTISVTVEVPDLVPSNTEHKVYVGQPLSLSCEPSEGDFVIRWEHNGVVIPGLPVPNKKRNALFSILSPYPYNYDLYLPFTSIQDAGVYSCSMISNDEIIVTQTINVTVSEIPTVESSTELAAYRIEDFGEGIVQVTCLPNDTSAVIAWQLLDGTPLSEAYPNAKLTPTNLNHTVTFISPPSGIEIVICGLYNNGNDLLNIQRITVVALSRPVSIWNNNRELVPNAVVNVFSNFIEDNLPFLSLRCFSTEGNGMLYWRTRNVSLLSTNLNSNSDIDNLTITESDHDITINYAQLNDQKTGYYACVSDISDKEFEALVTLDNPYWNLISSSTLLPPLGTNESIIIQYAYNSEGYGNTGADLGISLEFIPQFSEPYFRFHNKLSNPNKYLYYYNFTAGIGDRGLLVFQANAGGEIPFSSLIVDTYSIAPFFTSVSNPVYGRLGGAISLSCTANETTAPIVWGIWNFEEYFPLSDEPGFSFIPPVINEEISFAITSDTLDNGKDYSYDVDSGSYSTIRFRCGFKDGNNDGLFQPSSVFLFIRQYDISLSSNGDTVQNNSIVNDYDNNYYYYGEHKRFAEYPNSYQLECTTVQGNHNPVWTAEFFATPNVSVTIDSSFSELLYTNQQNEYVSNLIVEVSEDLSGRYTCHSSISGVLVTVILTAENPFVRAKSGNTISGIVGEEIILAFYAALDSVGDYNDDLISGLEVVHTGLDGTNVTLFIPKSCDNADGACYEYAFRLKELLPSHAGTYTAIVEKCEFTDDEEAEVCTRAIDTIHLTANVPQLVPSHINNAEFYIDEQLELSCVPAFGDYEIVWLYNSVPITEFLCNPRNNREKETCLSPEPYHTNLIIQPASTDDSGVYTCNLVVANQVISSATINVTVTERPIMYECFADSHCFESQSLITESISDCCSDGGSYVTSDVDLCVPCPTIQCPLEYNAGFLWSARDAGSVATVSCAEAGEQFSAFTDITRKCLSSGEWDGVDLTNCSLLSDVKTFASVSIVLADHEIIDAVDNQNELQDIMEELLDAFNLTYSSLSVKKIIEETGTLDFEIEFDVFSDEEISILAQVRFTLLAPSLSFGRFTTEESQSQLYILKVASSCPCNVNMTASEGIEVITKCSTASIANPCECVNDKCECQSPYVGDGTLCTIDSDGDMYPDEPLETCAGDNNTQKYCTKDNCVMVYNPDQDPDLCIMINGFTGCSYDTDITWGIEWANTDIGEMDTQPCPLGSIGTATRLCSSDGTWNEPNVIKCLPEVYQNLLDQSNAILSSTGDVRTRVSQAVVLTQNLAEATSQTLGNTESILPAAINATNEILAGVFSLLFGTLENDTDVSNETAGLRIAEVINNLLEDNQISGWSSLQTEGEDILGSDILLLNIENYGLYLSLTRNQSIIRLGNIAINAKQYRVEGDDQGALLFPQSGDLDDTDFPPAAAAVAIPIEVLDQRTKDNGFVPVVSTLCRNMERFLEFIDTNDTNNTQPAALVWSGQVTSLQRVVSQPINLTFRVFTNKSDNLSYRCVFWNGTESRWSSTGVATVGNRIDEYGYNVVDCQSNHLTPFSVLVDVSGAIQNANPGEYRALQIVSYIGCAISLACLAVTIVFFLTYGKRLFTSVHFFIHLNLAIALFCGYFVFAVGVETARGNQGGCGFVAALLQYFFLASFCWMLCEGIMLYLMLVVVFSTLSKRWYVFLAIGWAPPLIPVAIGLAAGYRHYGVRDDQGDLQFCWLATTRGVIWAFVGPMIIIVLINVVFLIMALRSVWRTTKSKKYKANDKTRGIVMSLLKATLILLPLLGLTWVFGLLTVDQNSSVFAWIFTLLNTAQGVAIFIFHVVRSDRVWPKISPYLERLIPKALKPKKSEISSQGSSSTTTLKYGNSTLKYRFRNAGYQMSTIRNNNFDMISEEPDLESTIAEEKTAPVSVNEPSDVEQRMKLKEAEAKSSEANDSITEDMA